MLRVKVRKINVLDEDDTEVINEMFSQMTGTGTADPDVIRPKISQVLNEIKLFCKTYDIFLKTKDLSLIKLEYSLIMDQIRQFLVDIKDQLGVTKDSVLHTEAMLYTRSAEEINEIYSDIKTNHCVRKIVITASNFHPHKLYIDSLSEKFIVKAAGLSWCPFAFAPQFDIKDIWICGETPEMIKKLILVLIQKTLKVGISLYEIINSPDIDIKKFSRVIISSIESLKKQIPHCDEAFKTISRSVEMLEDNFATYYKDSIAAESPSMIMENFIVDVSKKQKGNPVVMFQFKKIIGFIGSKIDKSNNPKVKKLFEILNKNLKLMDTENVNKNHHTEDSKEDATRFSGRTSKDTLPNINIHSGGTK